MNNSIEVSNLLKEARALLCVSVDPWLQPQGGQTAFARHILSALKTDLAVVSTCTVSLPVGQWVARDFEGTQIAFFNLGNLSPKGATKKPLIPDRLSVLYMASRQMGAVYRSGIRNVFIDDPELLIPAARYKWESACYNVAGGLNPAAISRYPAARLLARICEGAILRAVWKLRPAVIFAAGDTSFVEGLRNIKMLSPYRIEALPTRVDLARFYAEPKMEARERLGLARDAVLLASVGRLNRIKGWDLLLRVVEVLKAKDPNILLMLVGDGEDREKITAEVQARGLSDNIRISGFVSPETVRTFLSAADVYVVGSYSEGWSVAMLEALACGKPIVSTRVSGSHEMIIEGLNGFVVEDRDPSTYAAALRRALVLPDAARISRNIARRYSVSGLASDLRSQWPALKDVTRSSLNTPPVSH